MGAGYCGLGYTIPATGSPGVSGTATASKSPSAAASVSRSQSPGAIVSVSSSPSVSAAASITRSGTATVSPPRTASPSTGACSAPVSAALVLFPDVTSAVTGIIAITALSPNLLPGVSCGGGVSISYGPKALVTVDVSALPIGGNLTLTTCMPATGGFDTVMWTGSGCASSADSWACDRLGYNDDAGTGACPSSSVASRVILPRGPLQPSLVTVLVAGYGGTIGSFSLSASYAMPSSSPSATPSPGSLSGTPSVSASASGSASPATASATPSSTASAGTCDSTAVPVASLTLTSVATPVVTDVITLWGSYPNHLSGAPCAAAGTDFADIIASGPKALLSLTLDSSLPLGGNLAVSTCGARTTVDSILWVGYGCVANRSAWSCLGGNDDALGLCGTASTVVVTNLQQRSLNALVMAYPGTVVIGGRSNFTLTATYAIPSSTPSASVSRSGTPSPSVSKTNTPSASVSRSGTPSRSASRSGSATSTPSKSGTGSVSATGSISISSSVSASPSASPSGGAPPSGASSPSRSASPSPAGSAGAGSASASKTPFPSPGVCGYGVTVVSVNGTTGTAAPMTSVRQPGIGPDVTCALGAVPTIPSGEKLVYRLDLGPATQLGGALTVTTCGQSSADTELFVGGGCPTSAGDFASRASNDVSGCGLGSTVTIPFVTSRVQYVVVAAFSGSRFSSGLRWSYVQQPSRSATASKSSSRRPVTPSRSQTRKRKGRV